MLQNSIRGLREDRRRHDERMQALDLQETQLKAQLNDPRVRLAKQQADAELQMGIFTLPNQGQFRDENKLREYNDRTRPAINSVLADEGIELNDKNQPVFSGTNTPAKLPAWKRRALTTEVAVATIGSRLGHNELNSKIEKLQGSISKQQKDLEGYGSAKAKIYGPRLKVKKAELAKLEAERDNPEEQINRLMDANSKIREMRRAALANPDIGQQFYSRLDSATELNNQELKILLANSPKADKFKEVFYHKRDPKTGATITRSVMMPEKIAANAPASRDYADGSYTLGKVSQVGKGTQAPGPRGPGADMKPATINTINKDYTKFQSVVDAAALKDAGEKRIIQMLKAGSPDMASDEAARIAGFIQTDASAVVKRYNKLLEQYDYLYGRNDWFVGKGTKTKASGGGTTGTPKDILGIR